MATRSKAKQNKPLLASLQLSNELESGPTTSMQPSGDLLIVFDENIDHVRRSPARNRSLGISEESPQEREYNYYKVLIENRVRELAVGLGHELNAPLAAVLAYAQLLMAREDSDETLRNGLEAIYREALRASGIASNLLSFARRDKSVKKLISINEALEKTLDQYACNMKANNIELVLLLAPDLPRTMADFYQMQQVFAHIITNAGQAMAEAHVKGKLLVKTQRVSTIIQITFADDGPGISEEDLEIIFDPFFTTKEAGKGTGLGLSICSGLVQEHGGRLSASSNPGKGATFVVEIPIVSEAEPVLAEAA